MTAHAPILQSGYKIITQSIVTMSFPLSASFDLCLSDSIRPLRMIWVPRGTFWMGSPSDEKGRYQDVEGRFLCELTEGYWLQDTPVTNQQYRYVVGGRNGTGETAGGVAKDPESQVLPVTSVCYGDADNFCNDLCERFLVGKSERRRFCLPSEAQWEYACRAGTTSAYFHGFDGRGLERFAWYEANSCGRLHPVAQKQSNPWGFYDMIGNVAEWCRDEFAYYPKVASENWQGSADPSLGVIRSGSFRTPTEAGDLRCAARCEYPRTNRNFDIGFRVAFSVE